ncbi:MAG: sugar phosphate isomerase/epimerase [Gemmatimonadota bacterium]|nr:sugar phosphate isomerase/epimerase [Gemmatimonadota bacterium]
MKLSCTSVMLPRWDLDRTFDKLAEHGYDGIELRCRYNPDDATEEPSFWGRHLSDVSPDNVIQKADAIRAAERRTGIRVIALAPNVTLEESEIVEKLFRGAAALNPDNPPMIRIGAPRHDRAKPYWPQFLEARAGFANLVETAREYDVKILYEIHVGTVAVTCSRAIELLRDLDPDRIGAIYDIPNMLRVGLEDTKMGMELLGPYLAHCHIGNGKPVVTGRDDTGAQVWEWDFADIREGIADVGQIVRDFKAVGYSGYLSLEDFGPGDDDTKLGEQGNYIRRLLEA